MATPCKMACPNEDQANHASAYFMTNIYNHARPGCRSARFILTFLACLALSVGTLAAEFPRPVASALREAGIAKSSVAIVVRGVESARQLIRHNAEQPMNPASTMKLLTTHAALEMLGPAFTWKTEALVDNPPVNGLLDGDLYLRGSGDPRLGLEQFWLFLRQLRARGISHIRGDLVLDRSAFELAPHDPAEFDNEPLRPYNAGPDALLVNLKSLSFILHPEASAGARRVVVLHKTPGTEQHLTNALQVSDSDCGDWREKLQISLNGNSIILRGNFPAACGDKTLNLSPWPADLQIEMLFRSLWQELGGTLHGHVRSGMVPASAQLLAVHESPPLAEVVRDINKYSNNVMARQLFLTLDAARPATPAGAQHAIHAWLAGKKLSMPELVLDNGSGLSRTERISADNLARLLQAAWHSPVMPELMASLPLAGTDGTLKRRLETSSAAGRAHLKTGYLENVRSLAGYVITPSGKRWIVVFLINDPKARQGKRAMDALIEWVARQDSAAPVTEANQPSTSQ